MADQGQGTLRRQMLEKQRREMLVRSLLLWISLSALTPNQQEEFDRQKQALFQVGFVSLSVSHCFLTSTGNGEISPNCIPLRWAERFYGRLACQVDCWSRTIG